VKVLAEHERQEIGVGGKFANPWFDLVKAARVVAIPAVHDGPFEKPDWLQLAVGLDVRAEVPQLGVGHERENLRDRVY
jgi:hypothetical protein